MLGLITSPPSYNDYASAIIPYLLDNWLAEYHSKALVNEIVQVNYGDFNYLFDVIAERLIAAWGISRGKHSAPRPVARMAAFPLSNGPLYHRGHAIPHSLGGGVDINLVPQLGSVNIGNFRQLERQAVATPGALYFTHWLYSAGNNQKPDVIEQGFLYPGRPVDIRTFKN